MLCWIQASNETGRVVWDRRHGSILYATQRVGGEHIDEKYIRVFIRYSVLSAGD